MKKICRERENKEIGNASDTTLVFLVFCLDSGNHSNRRNYTFVKNRDDNKRIRYGKQCGDKAKQYEVEREQIDAPRRQSDGSLRP